MLRDAAGFATRHIGRTNRVEQCGLAVINVAHNRDHGRTRNRFGSCSFIASRAARNILGGLFLEGDDVGICSEEASHFACQFSIECLVDRREDTASQQTPDQVLGANFQFLGEILDADSFGDGNAARDGLRLIRKREPRRRHKALHRAFFYASRNVALSRPSSWTAGPAPRTRGARRRQPWSHSQRTVARGRGTRWVHGPALTGTQSWSWPCRSGGTRPLENRLTGYGTARHRTRR